MQPASRDIKLAGQPETPIPRSRSALPRSRTTTVFGHELCDFFVRCTLATPMKTFLISARTGPELERRRPVLPTVVRKRATGVAARLE